MKNENMVTVGLLAISLGGLTHVWFEKKKLKKQKQLLDEKMEHSKKLISKLESMIRMGIHSSYDPETATESVATSDTPDSDEFPLRLGSKGDRVERLKVWLTRKYGHFGIINDEFDKQTQALIERYLKQSTIDEDTYRKLKIGQPVYEQSLV